MTQTATTKPRKTAAAKPDKTVQQIDDNTSIQTQVAFEAGYLADTAGATIRWVGSYPSHGIARDYAVSAAKQATQQLNSVGVTSQVAALVRRVTSETAKTITEAEIIGSY